jgi:hypothetical protein
MEMQVRHGLAALVTVVDDNAEAVFSEAFLFRDDPDPGEEMAEEILVGGIGLPDPHDQLLGHEETVHRSLRRDVAKAEAEVVLVDDIARDFTIGDLLEDGFLSHGPSEGERGGEGEGKVGRKHRPLRKQSPA